MSKIKMRCITCGKWFQSANAKEVTCPECTQKARKEKLATKNAPPVSNKPGGTAGPGIQNRPAVPPPPKPKPVQSGTAHWLDTLEDAEVGQPDQPPPRPTLPTPPPKPRDNPSAPGGFRSPAGSGDRERGPGNYREGGSRGPGGYREENRGPGGYRVGGGSGLPGTTIGQRPRQPMEGGPRGPRPDRPPRPGGPREGGPGGQKPRGKGKPTGTPRPAAPPKPKREKTPPPQPFTPTSEQITQVEERYLELATPAEFDGIRTQIGRELGIPKKAVKKIIKELRDRQGIPSWWELQTYKGSPEELERIKNAYLPLLPVPPVGVHKQIADQLELKAGIVYQAIKAIRLEMNLPQYNDPSLHGPDFVASQKSNHAKTEEKSEEETVEETPVTEAESDVKGVEAATSGSENTDTTASTVSVTEGTAPSEA